MNTGLGNNGGSSSIVKSANALADLGHDVKILDSGRNQHTWEKLKVEHIVIKNQRDIPKDLDAVIATGFKSVKPTISIPAKIRAHWIRAWENWVFDEKKIVSNVLKTPTYKIVNSLCLQNKLLKYNVESHIIRPGYDFNDLYYIDVDRPNKIIVGALYREGKHGSRKRVNWALEGVRELKKKYNIEFWMFGSEKKPNNKIIDRYYRAPTISEKRELYSNVDIWLAPTKNEGLHLPPAEAALCNTVIVGTNAQLAGMSDYLIHQVNGLVSSNNYKSFVNEIEGLINNPGQLKKMKKNSKNEVLKLGNRKENMQRLVELLDSLSKLSHG